ncbi:MAG: 13E12 repeat family protein [Actinomycetota bacterium]|nr:13E12 repeat family protein [Actinomycetota bacterium]
MDRLAQAVAGLRADNLALLTARELEVRVRDLRRLADQVEAVFAAATAAFEDSEAYREVGARTGASWLRHQLRMSPGEARRRIRVGQRLKDLPVTRAAFLVGEIGLGQVEVLVGAVDDLGLRVVRGAEAELVALARLHDPWELREQIRKLTYAVDPDSVDAKQRNALAKRHFTVTPVGDEWVAKGVLDARPVRWSPRCWTPCPSPNRVMSVRRGSVVPTRWARYAARCSTRGCRRTTGSGPHLTVVLSWEALVGRLGAAPAQLDGFGPISTSLVRQLACDAGIARVVIAPDGSPLELGRTARTASAAQRRGAPGA